MIILLNGIFWNTDILNFGAIIQALILSLEILVSYFKVLFNLVSLRFTPIFSPGNLKIDIFNI